MKLKLFSIFMAIAVALAFTSCNGKKSSSSNESSDSSKSSKPVEDTNGPTGDIEKDAEALTLHFIETLENVDTTKIESMKNAADKIKKFDQVYSDYYKKIGKEKELDEAFKRMTDKYEKRYNNIDPIFGKMLNLTDEK